MIGPELQNLKTTPLDALHRSLDAKMVPFAGYAMPVQYADGVLKEHIHTRNACGLFDVSHMGQAILRGTDAAKAIEKLVPGDYQGLGEGHTRYTLLTNDAGGILDDLMITRRAGDLYIVVNAACKDQDFAHIQNNLKGEAELEVLTDRALLALQGPKAEAVLSRLNSDASEMTFMTCRAMELAGSDCIVTRSGYTGEDGYEISIPEKDAERIARLLLDEAEVKPIGLGARDSLRLEAGLCLYGSDINTVTTPIEAGLKWAVSKRRRIEGGFPGANIILGQLTDGTKRLRVGILPDGRAPARAHTEIQSQDGKTIGEITSGGFGPTVGGPVAMGYVETEYAEPNTPLNLMVRGKALPARVATMPFIEQRYKK